MPDQIQRLRDMLAKATPGKWWWRLNTKSHSCTLYSSGAGGGWRIVMDFVRYGMRRACPRFQVKGLMYRANEIPEQPVPDHNGDAKITHPDAELIVAAVNALPALLEVVEASKDVERHQCDLTVPDYVEGEAWKKLREALAKLEAIK